jgi:hypothetical protein
MVHGSVDRRLNRLVEFLPVVGFAVVSGQEQRHQFVAPG